MPLPGPARSASRQLSRGAARAAFIETDRAALAALRRNLAALDEEDAADIIAGDATRPPRARFACALAFLDPPYRSGLAAPALTALLPRWAGSRRAPWRLIEIRCAKEDPFPRRRGFRNHRSSASMAPPEWSFLRRQGERAMTDMPQITLPDGEKRPGLWPGHLAYGRRAATASPSRRLR
jgi:hypothetical protein